MMTIFPFEEQLYRDAGVRADFVGHTMVRDIPETANRDLLRRELGLEPSRYSIALVPGSPPAEIRRMLPVMCETARIHVSRYPDTQFVLPVAGEHLRPLVNEIVSQHRVPVVVQSSDTVQIMAACDSGLVTSGTATLQATLAGMPHAVAYKLDQFTWLLAIKVLKPLVMDKDIHVAIANVLAINMEKQGKGPLKEVEGGGFGINCRGCGRPLFVPELLQDNVTPENLAEGSHPGYECEEPSSRFHDKGIQRDTEYVDSARRQAEGGKNSPGLYAGVGLTTATDAVHFVHHILPAV